MTNIPVNLWQAECLPHKNTVKKILKKSKTVIGEERNLVKNDEPLKIKNGGLEKSKPFFFNQTL